jgi:hypothetical protein
MEKASYGAIIAPLKKNGDIPKPSYGAIIAPHTLVKILIFLTVQIWHRLL